MSRVVSARRRRRLRSATTPAPAALPTAIDPNIYYNEAECAAFLRLRNPKTLCIWRCRGEHPELKHTKVFGRVLFRGQAILDFLSGTATAPDSQKRKRA